MIFSKEILANHVAVLGKTGSGKTSTLKLLVEQVVEENARVCILDPIKSDHWGLTSSASGKRAGLPFYILGGPHGHVPLHSSAGEAIGELVANGSIPLSIIDMADFEPGGLQRFFVDFARTLLRKQKGVIHLVMEEAHEFAPKERVGVGQENMCIHWAKKLAISVRSKGIRLALGTQRIQSLHNALLGSCETVIVHRITLPADQEPVVKWLRANVKDKDIRSQIEDTMSSLPTGTGWLCSGEAKIFEQVKFPRIKTFDNSATPTADTPDPDKVVTNQVPIEQLRAIIGDAVKEAEANDPKVLRKQVADLTAQVQKLTSAKPAAALPAPLPAVDRQAVMQEAESAGFVLATQRAASLIDTKMEGLVHWVKTTLAPNIAELLGSHLAEASGHIKNLATMEIGAQARRRPPQAAAIVRPTSYPKAQELPARSSTSDEKITPTTRKILDQIHGAYPMALSFEAAALRAGVSRRSSAYDKYRAEVLASIEVQPRDDGRFQSSPGYAKPMPPGDPVDSFVARLPPSYANMLRAIAGSPYPLTREQVATEAKVSPTSSGLNAGLNELIALDIVVKDDSGEEDTYTLDPDIKEMRR